MVIRLRPRPHRDPQVHRPLPARPPRPGSRHVLQQIKDHVATGISKDWQIERNCKASRGFRRTTSRRGDWRHSGLQVLMHLPKFVHWIKDHNRTLADGVTIINPCRPAGTYQISLPSLAGEGTVDIDHDPNGDCVGCAMKRLTEQYWGGVVHGGVPRLIGENDRDMQTIHGLADTIWGPDIEFESADPPSASQPRGRMIETMQFVAFLLDALSWCTQGRDTWPPTAGGDSLWQQQHAALFRLVISPRDLCSRCGNWTRFPPGHEKQDFHIFNVNQQDPDPPQGRYYLHVRVPRFQEDRPETQAPPLEYLIHRYFDSKYVRRDCPTCHDNVRHYRTEYIIGAPDNLFIKLDTTYTDSETNNNTRRTKTIQFENRNPVKIPRVLNLTRYQHIYHSSGNMLKYELSSVLCRRRDRQPPNTAAQPLGTPKNPVAPNAARMSYISSVRGANERTYVINQDGQWRVADNKIKATRLRDNPQFYPPKPRNYVHPPLNPNQAPWYDPDGNIEVPDFGYDDLPIATDPNNDGYTAYMLTYVRVRSKDELQRLYDGRWTYVAER